MVAGASDASVRAASKDRSSRARCCRVAPAGCSCAATMCWRSRSGSPSRPIDKQQIYMSWKGFRHGPKEVLDRLNRGEIVDPETYYFRTTPYFETSSEKYGWMNRICSVATGFRNASGRTFEVFQVL